jgi:hypothetical protein
LVVEELALVAVPGVAVLLRELIEALLGHADRLLFNGRCCRLKNVGRLRGIRFILINKVIKWEIRLLLWLNNLDAVKVARLRAITKEAEF